MMPKMFWIVWIGLALLTMSNVAADDPTPAQLLKRVGIAPQGDQRGQMDIVGFAHTASQMDNVLDQCRRLAATDETRLRRKYGWKDDTTFIAGVCPHDDYYYAGRLYQLLIPKIRARRVIIFGVFHKARIFNCRDRLVFDGYNTWHGPYGPVKVSPLRQEIIRRLPASDFIIDNDMQMVEHSVEAMAPFLQAYRRDVEIVSILVPAMEWETMDRLSTELASALEDIIREKNWRLGKDLAFICSSDAVHYGDEGWGGRNYAAFGVDALGYQMAVKRDREMAENLLSGPISSDKLKDFLYRCVDPKDVTQYRITWCGRFSIPFGLNVVSRLTAALENRLLTGFLLDYGTSVSEASLDTDGLDGMGPTAPNNFHHFVGYVSIGYR